MMDLQIESISKKKFQFTWKDSVHETDIAIDMPDLLQTKSDIWGDWGPMYTFHLNPESLVSIKYNQDQYSLEQKTLSIETPMLAAERKQFPFSVKINDNFKGLRFEIFLNNSYETGKINVVRISDNVLLTSQVS